MDLKNRRLIWPEDRSPIKEVQLAHQTIIPKKILQRPAIDQKAQANAARRDRQIEAVDAKSPAKSVAVPPTKPCVPRTETMDRRDGLAKMERSIKQSLLPPPPPAVPTHRDKVDRLIEIKNLQPIKTDLGLVGAAAFTRTAGKLEEAFKVSIHDIKQSIVDRLTERYPDKIAELATRLPACY